MKSILDYLWLLLLFSHPATTNASYWTDMPRNSITPVCSDEEELFQLQFLKDDFTREIFGASYRVVTANNETPHAECTTCSNRFPPGANIELCLPKDECHTALVSRLPYRYFSCYCGVNEELVAKWGNKTIHRNDAFFIDRIDFGDGCQMDPVCNAETEILFEFFLNRHYKNLPSPFSWTLSGVEMGERSKIYLEGQAPNNGSSFVYETACVPRDSCLEFYMGYPNNTDIRPFDNSKYSIRLDGVVYSEGDLNMANGYFTKKLNQTTNLGSCTVENLCNASAEDLFEMEFTVSSTAGDEDCESSSALEGRDLTFKFHEEGVVGWPNYHFHYGNYNDFEVNRTYAYLSCVPNNKCFVFSWETDSPIKDYNLFQNGKELAEREVYKDDFLRKVFTNTKLGPCSGDITFVPRGIVVSVSLTVVTLLLTCL